MAYNDSHLSQPTKNNEKAPVRQSIRRKLGEKVTGQTNPYGSEKGPTQKKVGNAPCTY